MCRCPDAKDGNIDCRHDSSSSPLKFLQFPSVLGNEQDSINDDLHQQLDLKGPEEGGEK